MKSKIKCMVVTFFNRESQVYTYTEPDGETADVDWYVNILKRLITVHIPCEQPHYHNGQWNCIMITHSRVVQHVGFLNLTQCGTDSSHFLQPRFCTQ